MRELSIVDHHTRCFFNDFIFPRERNVCVTKKRKKKKEYRNTLDVFQNKKLHFTYC